jgi:hypothetical protein
MRHTIRSRHLVAIVTIAVHRWWAVAHTGLHRVWHVATSWDEGLALWIELLAVIAAGNRMLVMIWLAVEGSCGKLAIRVRRRHWSLMGRRHGSIPWTRWSVGALSHGVGWLLRHLRPPRCHGHVLGLLVRVLVRRHWYITHLWGHLRRHASVLEGHVSLKVVGQVISVLHRAIIGVRHCVVRRLELLSSPSVRRLSVWSHCAWVWVDVRLWWGRSWVHAGVLRIGTRAWETAVVNTILAVVS